MLRGFSYKLIVKADYINYTLNSIWYTLNALKEFLTVNSFSFDPVPLCLSSVPSIRKLSLFIYFCTDQSSWASPLPSSIWPPSCYCSVGSTFFNFSEMTVPYQFFWSITSTTMFYTSVLCLIVLFLKLYFMDIPATLCQ